MSITAVIVNAERATDAIAESLACERAWPAFVRTYCAEHVRAAVVAPAMRNASWAGTEAVHVARIASRFRRAARWIGPSEAPPEIDVPSVCSELADVGEIEGVGHGYWLAAPTRIVASPIDLAEALLVSPLPTHTLSRAVEAPVQSAGLARFGRIRDVGTQTPRGAVFCSAEDWLCLSSESLADWTTRTIQTLTMNMASADGARVDGLEAYVPEERRRTGKRWLAAELLRNAVTTVCRPRSGTFFARPYYFAAFAVRDGNVTLERQVSLDEQTRQRLVLGIDARARSPRSVSVIRSGALIAADLAFGLPKPEARVLSLGWRIEQPDSAMQTRVFHLRAWSFVSFVLARLGIAISEKGGR